MLGFALGVVSNNAAEWLVHKYVLHGMGKKKGSFWSFHWHEHHKNARKHGGYDPVYEQEVEDSPSRAKEVLGIVAGALVATPLLPVAPGFVAGAWASSAAYYFIHKKAHLDPEWGKRWVPWHVDHHLGPNQHANWCVTWPLFDWVMGTREPFVGTESEHAPAKATEVVARAS
jgi:hypothetical protein